MYSGPAGHGDQRAGRLDSVKHGERGGEIWRQIIPPWLRGQGGEVAAGGLNDWVLVERSLIPHLLSPPLLLLFSFFQNSFAL